jgi:hypothetical protein
MNWPSISEQQAYWDKRERLIETMLSSISVTLQSLTASVEGLLAICKDQQTQIDTLKQQK